MKYCVLNNERDGTGYHEFYRGKLDKQTFWRDDSLYIYDYTLFHIKGFVGALKAVVPSYDGYGTTEVSREQWERIGKTIPNGDQEALKLYQELSEWTKEVFEKHDCFTILGI